MRAARVGAAHGIGIEARELDTFAGEAVERGGPDRAAVEADVREAEVVDDEHDDVGRRGGVGARRDGGRGGGRGAGGEAEHAGGEEQVGARTTQGGAHERAMIVV